MGQNRGVKGLPSPRLFHSDDERFKWDTRVYDAISGILGLTGSSNGGNGWTDGYLFFGSADGGFEQNIAVAFSRTYSMLVVRHLLLGGGSVSPHTAPMYWTASDLMSEPENGAMEYDGDYWYGTDSSGARHQFAFAGSGDLWTDGTGFLYPTTTTNLVAIGDDQSPNGSALLGLWGTLGLSHANGTAVTGGELISQWIPYASLNLLEQDVSDNDAATTGRDAVRLGTSTANPMVFYFNGLGACAIGYGSHGFPAILPADYNAGGQNFSLGGTGLSRIRGCHLQTGTVGNSQGLFLHGSTTATRGWLGASDTSTVLYSGGTGNAIYLLAGNLTSYIYLGSTSTAGDAGSATIVCKAYRLNASSIRRWLPGTDDSTDLGGATGGADDERWRNCYLSGLDNWSSASVAAAATLTVTTNLTLVTGNTNIDYITTTGINAGTVIILNFSGTPTVNHNTGAVPGGTAAIYLAGAANFAATANDTLTLVYNGTVWSEVARAVI